MPAAFLLVLAVLVLGEVLGHDWGYRGKEGPAHWKGLCKSGHRQSPIDIRASYVDYSLLDRLHFVNYDETGPVTVQNNGHSVVATGFSDWDAPPIVFGADMKDDYRLAQFHLHWGDKDSEGSEHRIGGLMYPAELHLVHVKEGFSLADALKMPDGIAVVGVFLEIGFNSEPLAIFSQALGNVRQNSNTTKLGEGFSPRSVIPTQLDAFYRYDGSLTTPSCDEAVQWIVMAEPITVTRQQLSQLRKIRDNDNEEHNGNYRPPQPLNGRRVLFRPPQYDKAVFCSGTFSSLSSWLLLLLSSIVATNNYL